MNWGMSAKVGNIDYSEAAQGYQGNTGGFSVSAKTKETIEDEVKRILDEGYDLAYKTLVDNEEAFERIAQGLLEYETLSGDELKRVMKGESPHKEDDNEDDGNAPSVAAIPKTKPRSKPSDDGMEPEPST